MAKGIMTFEQLPKAVSELTTQVMELRDMVAALKPAVPDEKHRIVGIDETCVITHKAEPREVMQFGNVYTPLTDLITTRYEEQLYTIFTTNLPPAQLEEKYGKRIVDRLNEMVEKVVFENESYRR